MVDMRTREGRALREGQTRDAETRDPNAYKPPSSLPDPDPMDGVRYRWIRTSTWGTPDASNVSMRFREGWVPVKKEDHPELAVVTDYNSKFPENIEVGGLLLCRIDAASADARAKYYDDMTRKQLQSSDYNFMRQSDPRMPVLKPERTTRTTFGGGQPPR